MGALRSADRATGSTEPVETLATRVRATADARPCCAWWLSLSGAGFAGERR